MEIDKNTHFRHLLLFAFNQGSKAAKASACVQHKYQLDGKIWIWKKRQLIRQPIHTFFNVTFLAKNSLLHQNYISLSDSVLMYRCINIRPTIAVHYRLIRRQVQTIGIAPSANLFDHLIVICK